MEISQTIDLLGAVKLGQGQFGEVYLKTISGAPRAIKSIALKKDADTEKARKELELQQKVNCEFVVAVYNFHFDQQLRCLLIVMEFMEGGSLLQLIEDNPLRESDTLSFLEQMLRGVVFMHERGVVHRDIKPQNILLDQTKTRLKICDFGLAKEIKLIRDQTRLTTSCGTAAYMSPEAIRGGTPYGTNTDIWSIGATAVHMVTGERPYPHIAEVHTLSYLIGSRKLKHDLKGMASPQLTSVVGKFMEYDGSERPKARKALNLLEKLQTDLAEQPSASGCSRASGAGADDTINLPIENLNLRSRTSNLSNCLEQQLWQATEPRARSMVLREEGRNEQSKRGGSDRATASSGHEREEISESGLSKRPRRNNVRTTYHQLDEDEETNAPGSDSDWSERGGETDSDSDSDNQQQQDTGSRKTKNKKSDTSHKRYKCPDCEFETKRKWNLKLHQKSLHLNERPFECATCDYAAATMWQLKRHEQIHSDARPFACRYPPCQKRFKTENNRCYHENIHKGARYECKPCKVSFTHRNSYHRHMESLAHSEPMHSCRCGESFTTKANMKRHQESGVCPENSQ